MADQNENEQRMVTVTNKLTRRTLKVPVGEVDDFLRKHTLFEYIDEVPSDTKRKAKTKKRSNKQKEEQKARQTKSRTNDLSAKSSPSSTPSELEGRKRKNKSSTEAEITPAAAGKASPFITLTLKEMHEIVRLFTSSPVGCVDWGMIAGNVTGGRLSLQDVEYVANEFLPHVHYRPSLGLIIMERHSKLPTEYQKHRQTMKRMRQGLPVMLKKARSIFNGHNEQTFKQEPDVDMAEDPGENTVTPLSTPDSPSGTPTDSDVKKLVNVDNYQYKIPPDVLDELNRRCDKAIDRFQRGEIPVYALRNAPVASIESESGNLTATGRIRKRYETKAMRLAREAAGTAAPVTKVKSESSTLSCPTPAVSASPFAPPPFFLQTARQFARSASSVDNDE